MWTHTICRKLYTFPFLLSSQPRTWRSVAKFCHSFGLRSCGSPSSNWNELIRNMANDAPQWGIRVGSSLQPSDVHYVYWIPVFRLPPRQSKRLEMGRLRDVVSLPVQTTCSLQGSWSTSAGVIRLFPTETGIARREGGGKERLRLVR